MASTRIRSFVKGVSWELFSFVLTVTAVYMLYGNIVLSLQFSAVLTIIKIVLFFWHERAWKKIRWGKYHYVKGRKVRG